MLHYTVPTATLSRLDTALLWHRDSGTICTSVALAKLCYKKLSLFWLMYAWFAYPVRRWNGEQQSNGLWNIRLNWNTEKFRGKCKVHSVYITRHPLQAVITEYVMQLPGTFGTNLITSHLKVKDMWEKWRNCQTACMRAAITQKNPATTRRDIFSTPYVSNVRIWRTLPACCWTPLPSLHSATNTSYFTLGRDYGCAPIVNQSGKATLDICSILSNSYRLAEKTLTGLL